MGRMWQATDDYGDNLRSGRQAAPLNRVVDWGAPFRVTHAPVSDADGPAVPLVTVNDYVPDLYPPTVYHDPDGDVTLDGDGWEPLTGYTGQHGYSGAVMHPSELLAGGLARDILATPGVYVVTEVLDDDPDDSDGPIGWAILKRTEV